MTSSRSLLSGCLVPWHFRQRSGSLEVRTKAQLTECEQVPVGLLDLLITHHLSRERFTISSRMRSGPGSR